MIILRGNFECGGMLKILSGVELIKEHACMDYYAVMNDAIDTWIKCWIKYEKYLDN